MDSGSGQEISPGRRVRFDVGFSRFELREPGWHRNVLSRPAPERGLIRASPGRIQCLVGAETESVSLDIAFLEHGPVDVLDDYEDVVEASYEPLGTRLSVLTWPERPVRTLSIPLAGTLRLRYHLRNADRRAAACLLLIWLSPATEAVEFKITSAAGRFWHPSEMLRGPFEEIIRHREEAGGEPLARVS